MLKFIRYFIYEWRNYPLFFGYAAQIKANNPKLYAEMEASDRKKGIKPYKSRFDFALRNAKIRYNHRNDYKE